MKIKVNRAVVTNDYCCKIVGMAFYWQYCALISASFIISPIFQNRIFFAFQTPQTTLVIFFLQDLWSTLSSSFILILNNLAVLLVRAIDNWGPSFAMWSKNPSLESGSVVVYLPIRRPFFCLEIVVVWPWQTCHAWYLQNNLLFTYKNPKKK